MGSGFVGLKSQAWLKDEEDEKGMGWIWESEVGEESEESEEIEEKEGDGKNGEDRTWMLEKHMQCEDEGETDRRKRSEVEESDYSEYDEMSS